MDYEVIRINEDTWRIEDGGVRFFLLEGSREALLIDSGMNIRNAREIAESLTERPVRLLNTHADRDHIAGNGAFETFYMHPSEAAAYYHAGGTGQLAPVWDGDVLDLGDRPLTIVALPGHTPGSIAVLDQKYRALISGDPIQDGDIFMFGAWREIHAYIVSLQRLKRFLPQFDRICPSHGTFPVKPELIDQLIDGAQRILDGGAEYEPMERFGIPVRRYDIGVAAFLMDGETNHEGGQTWNRQKTE